MPPVSESQVAAQASNPAPLTKEVKDSGLRLRVQSRVRQSFQFNTTHFWFQQPAEICIWQSCHETRLGTKQPTPCHTSTPGRSNPGK